MSRLRACFSFSLLAAASTLGACSKTASPPGGFGVNVTVDATALSTADRAKITTGELHVLSDKAGATAIKRTLDLHAVIAGGQVRFHYLPGADVAAGDSLTFGLDALDSAKNLISSGSADPVKLLATAVAVTIKLTASGDAGTTEGGNGKSNGTACVTGTECGSTFCTDGVCCDQKCDDVCASCNVSAATKGKCTAYAADTDPDMECAAKLPPAVQPDDGGSTQAGDASGDGPAADAAAPLSDASMAEAGESDAQVVNTPDGGFMSMPKACAGTCNGAKACKYPDNKKSCGTPFCNTHKEVGSFVCDGNGGCGLDFSQCTDFTCDEATGACRTTCSAHFECQLGEYCFMHKCVQKNDLGLACASDDECRLGHCSSGVCCNTSCNTPPLSCNSSGSVGQCKCAECPTGPCQIFYPDVDGDTFGDRTATYAAGNAGTAKAACANKPPVGFVADNTDCDDKDPMAHPGQTLFFGFASKGGRFDYNCDDKMEKETPEYPGGSCRFCGAVGTCDQTTTTCSSANQTASFQCPQETPVITKLALPVDPAFGADSLGHESLSLPPAASAASPGTTAIPGAVLPPPICRICILQCCGCQPADKTGFRQAVNCGDSSVPAYTCGSCSVAGGGASAMTPSFKQQRCR